jgi:hypothetical protein
VAQNPLGHAGLEQRVGGVDAHAAGVGAGVALADALVILRGRERRDVLAVAEAEEADLVAFEELLDDHLPFGLAQQRTGEEALGGLDRGAARLADEHALAGGQAVGLDHDGRMEDFDGLFELFGGGADGVVGGGNVVPLQEALGEALAGLEHGRGFGGPKDAQAALLKGVHNAERERELRADDGEPGLLVQRELTMASRFLRSTGTQRAICAMPPLPGAQTTSVTFWLRFTAQASACSRPPEPKIKTFIAASLLSLCGGCSLLLKG